MALAQYRRLLDRYHRLIDLPDWHGPREALVSEMDRVWVRMSDRDREAALEHARTLYRQRIGETA